MMSVSVILQVIAGLILVGITLWFTYHLGKDLGYREGFDAAKGTLPDMVLGITIRQWGAVRMWLLKTGWPIGTDPVEHLNRITGK